MSNRKPLVTTLIVGVMLVLVVLGGVWSSTSAQNTVPTHRPPTPTPLPGDLTGQFGEGTCLRGKLATDKELDLFFMRYPQKFLDVRWGGVQNPAGSACQEAVEMICTIPVRFLPQRGQLNYYREGLEVRQFVKGKLDETESCAPKAVYFELTGYERYMYDHNNDRIGFFIYNPENKTWESCPDLTFDADAGDHGRLVCNTTQWGFFALGWPAKPK